MRPNKLLTIFLILLTLPSYAFFCPTTFNQINIGDTIAQVEQQCGKPDNQEEKDVDPKVPQEWNYLIPQTASISGPVQQTQGTLKTSIAFNKEGKAINISVNGIGVGASSICSKPIKLNDTIEKVKAACGAPNFINKQTTTEPPTKLTTYYFKSNPPKKLIFENGLLARTE